MLHLRSNPWVAWCSRCLFLCSGLAHVFTICVQMPWSVTWFLEVSSDHVFFAIYVQILESLGAQDCSFCSLDWKRGKEEGRQGEEEREGKNRGRGGKQGEGEGREVNLFIHPPTSRSPAPAASTGNNPFKGFHIFFHLLYGRTDA